MPGLVYRCAEQGYHTLRMAKNRLLNLVEAPLIVLTYHRVTSLPGDPQQIAVTPENFRQQLSYLKETLPVVRLEEDWSKSPKPAVVITFDDGYADNALEALPIVEEVGVPATFFVSTGNIGSDRMFWWDELEALIGGAGPFPERFVLEDPQGTRVWPTVGAADRSALYQALHPLLRTMDLARRENWFAQLRTWARRPVGSSPRHRCLSVEELRRLAASRWVTVGAHTVNHQPLAYLSQQDQQREISGSKRELEGWLGREITVFSYPYGGITDYTKESVELCREAGFVKAVANFPGQAHRWTDPYNIPRQVVRNWNRDQFAGVLKRFRYA